MLKVLFQVAALATAYQDGRTIYMTDGYTLVWLAFCSFASVTFLDFSSVMFLIHPSAASCDD